MQPWLLFGEWLTIPTYPAVVAVGIALSTIVLRREARRDGLSVRLVMDAVFVALLTAIAGARFFHVLVEAPARYLAEPLAVFSPDGGWTFYGGLLGGLLGVTAVARWRGENPWRVLDVAALAIPFAQATARMACLAAGCCYGRLADWPFGWAVPWGVTYHRHGQLPEELLAVPLHPAPLYLSMMCLVLFVGLTWLRQRQRFDGQILAALLVGYGAGRAALDSFRGDVERGLFFGDRISAAQVAGVLTVVAGVLLWRRLARCTPSS